MYKAIEARVSDNREKGDFIEKEIARIQKRNYYKSTKHSKKQVANQGYQEVLFNVLGEADAPMTIADIKGYHTDSHSLSNGQVLPRPYAYGEARLVLSEEALSIATLLRVTEAPFSTRTAFSSDPVEEMVSPSFRIWSTE